MASDWTSSPWPLERKTVDTVEECEPHGINYMRLRLGAGVGQIVFARHQNNVGYRRGFELVSYHVHVAPVRVVHQVALSGERGEEEVARVEGEDEWNASTIEGGQCTGQLLASSTASPRQDFS